MTPDEPRDVIVETHDRITRITINRPERRNAMSWEVVRGLRAAFATAREDPDVRVVVLAGAGDKAFCSGADLGSMGHGIPTGGTAGSEDAREAGLLGQHEARGELAGLFEQMWGLGKPTIARVQGWAMAGGFGLALACDLVIASERARFGAPEVNVGLWPFMITVPLVRSMPPKKALELMLTGRFINAQRAFATGLVSELMPDAEVDAAAAKLALEMTETSPLGLRLTKECLSLSIDAGSLEQAVAMEDRNQVLCVRAGYIEEGARAFLEKRKPRYAPRA